MKPLSLSGRDALDWVETTRDAMPEDGRALVSLDCLLADGPDLCAGNAAVGVRVGGDTDVATLSPFLDRLSLIGIDFPHFQDGRGFSLAARLREQGYGGEIRAFGHVIPDQAAFLCRCGVDSVQIANDSRLPAFEAAVGRFSVVMQSGPDGARSAMMQRHQSQGASK